ncbi:hypothetical protein QC763_400680 [Podospora pseudopauciseta]|uniref:Protein kinase domain-containing protein n=1 Tax=Podospora pseudopauciseta TaxID=2093780 RepID=A0ABR0HBP5_9PEZI|nr:hypothetical protein QC763_400680 [Podospora pseudopauciseta]
MSNDTYDLEALQNGSLANLGLTKFKLIPTPSLTVFPDEIFTFGPSLTYLDLSGTGLSSLPPNFTTSLPNLKILFLSNCAFTTFPDLSSHHTLEMVAFRHNSLTSIPENTLPPKLRWLILTDNRIPFLPSSISSCPNLEKCLLAGNNLSTLPPSLTQCQNLTLLRLSANNFSSLPKFLFTAFPKLAYLSFAGNPCSLSSRKAHKLPFGLLDIPYSSLAISRVLGRGASGIISQAEWKPSPDSDFTEDVAVKMFRGSLTSDGRPEDEMEAVLLAGSHESLIGVVGKVTGYSEGEREGVKGGIVMSLVPRGYEVLGLPPDLESCTRDRFTEGERGWEMGKAVEMLTGIAGAGAHLHGRRICHGDLYAHNILASKEDGHGLLGDFGAASVYGEEEDGVERVEVAAFGRLVGDVLGLVEEGGEGERERAMRRGLEELQRRCEDGDVEGRPDFDEVVEVLRGMLGWRGVMRIPEVPN